MATFGETDEDFARRLQAQEMGMGGGIRDPQRAPLMASNNNTPWVHPDQPRRRQYNPTIINTRINELSTARATVCAILFVNTPQIIAAAAVLSVHWNDPDICDSGHTRRWKFWAAISAYRMLIYSILVLISHLFKSWLDARPRYLNFVSNCKNLVDAFGLIWFIVGNMWLFGDDELGCHHPERSPVYGLCVSMLIINYLQICLPCIVALMMIPIFCFCMPCLIRVLARMQVSRATPGANDTMINSIPLVVIGPDNELLNADTDNSCPICLNDLAVGDEARILKCKHCFHRQCVDEWLRVNATCPTCRKSLFDEENPQSSLDESQRPLTAGSTHGLGSDPAHGPGTATTVNATPTPTPTTGISRRGNEGPGVARSPGRMLTLNFQLSPGPATRL